MFGKLSFVQAVIFFMVIFQLDHYATLVKSLFKIVLNFVLFNSITIDAF